MSVVQIRGSIPLFWGQQTNARWEYTYCCSFLILLFLGLYSSRSFIFDVLSMQWIALGLDVEWLLDLFLLASLSLVFGLICEHFGAAVTVVSRSSYHPSQHQAEDRG
jgi:hypothetical protein